VVLAAIFGVGAPEALLVGVVALVVFGPKGLAQAVKSLGATLKTFSPTIKELASVTNELSSTLQEQIGLDDIRNEFRNPSPSYSRASDVDKPSTTTSKPEVTKATDDDSITPEVAEIPSRVLEAQIEESKRLAWGEQGPPSSTSATAQADPPQPPSEWSDKPEKPAKKTASDLSMDELEAELARRKSAAASK
jgi:TatA/E family protein of Tat protein translocase